MQILVGQNFWLVLGVNDARELWGVRGYFEYDPSRVEIVTINEIPVIETYKFFGDNEKIRIGLVDNRQGKCGFAITMPGVTHGIAGTGKIARIKMYAKNEGGCQIAGKTVEAIASDIVVKDGIPDNRVLPSQFTNAEIEIIRESPPISIMNIYFSVEL